MTSRALLIGSLAPALVLAILIDCESAQPPPGASTSTPQEPALSPSLPSDGGTSTELDAAISTAQKGVQDLVAQLQATISAKLPSYGQVDLEDLNDLVTVALLRAESPGGRGDASAGCTLQAIQSYGFSALQTATLCQDVLFDSAACAARAHVLGFDRDSAVTLCARRGSTETADCAQTVFATLGFSRSQAVAVCADRDGATTAQCAASALTTGALDRDQTSALCAHRGSTTTAECARVAIQTFGFTRTEAVALCANRGASETAGCAGSALESFGFSRQQAVALCANRGQASNATCAGVAFTAGRLTRDEAVEACRRPQTVLP
jgi:hypothetical protein